MAGKHSNKKATMEEMKCDLTSRTPVERAFYESFIMSNRWAVARLYAVNILESTKFKQELKHLGQERKTNLSRMDDEIELCRTAYDGYSEEKEQVLFLPTSQENGGVMMTPVQIGTKNPDDYDLDEKPLEAINHSEAIRTKSVVGQPYGLRKHLYRPLRMDVNQNKPRNGYNDKPKIKKRKKKGSNTSSSNCSSSGEKMNRSNRKCKSKTKKVSQAPSVTTILRKTSTASTNSLEDQDVYSFSLTGNKKKSPYKTSLKPKFEKTKCNFSEIDNCPQKDDISTNIHPKKQIVQKLSKPRTKKIRKVEDKPERVLTKCPMAYKKSKTQCLCVTTNLLKLICDSMNEDGLEAAEIERGRIRTLSECLSESKISNEKTTKNNPTIDNYENSEKNCDNTKCSFESRNDILGLDDIEKSDNKRNNNYTTDKSPSEDTIKKNEKEILTVNTNANTENMNSDSVYGTGKIDIMNNTEDNTIQIEPSWNRRTPSTKFGNDHMREERNYAEPFSPYKQSISDTENLNKDSRWHSNNNNNFENESVTTFFSPNLESKQKVENINKAEQTDDLELIQAMTNVNNMVPNNDIKLNHDIKKNKNVVQSNDFKILQDLHRYHALWLKHVNQNIQMSNHSDKKRSKLIVPKLEEEKKVFHKQKNNNNALTEQTINYIRTLGENTASVSKNENLVTDGVNPTDLDQVDGGEILSDQELDKIPIIHSHDKINHQKLTYRDRRLIQSAGPNKENIRSLNLSLSNSAPTSRINSAIETSMRRKAQKKIYNDYFAEHDFTGTTQRYISRDMQVDLTKMFLQ